MSHTKGRAVIQSELAPSAASGVVVAAALRVLAECRSFITGLDGRSYSAPSQLLVGGTIGKHLRHTLDHFAGVTSALQDQTICYDHRTRDVPMETEPGAGLAEIHRLREVFGNADPRVWAATVRVRIMCSADGEEAEVCSTLARELAFATHHAIHHQAMMKAIAIEHGVVFDAENSEQTTDPRIRKGSGSVPSLSPTFGVAPSTAKHAVDNQADSTVRPVVPARPPVRVTPDR